MKNINRFVIVGLFLTVAILLLSLQSLEEKIQDDTNNKSIIKLEEENKIIFLENKINEMQLRIDMLENDINIIKNPTPSPTVTPTPSPRPTNTPVPTKKPIPTKVPIENKVQEKESNFKPKPSVPDEVEIVKEHRDVNTNITEKSGLSAEEIDKLLNNVLTVRYDKKSSKLLNNGVSFSKMENEYNVNVLYALSVSTFETNWGTQGVARQNNLFAFINNNGSGYRQYNSVEDSIMSFGNSARNSYFNKGLTSVNRISSVYCPPNSAEWTRQVNWLISFYAESANNILQK